MKYRVVIPTAGLGSRLHDLTRYVNKSLVSVADRPVICHIIEQFPQDVEFVIALGYKGDLVREFLELAYPERKFFFVEVSPFEGEGSGLGLTLLACKEFLQQPFIFNSCDTLVLENVPCPEHNWMGYAETVKIDSYRTIDIQNQKVKAICEKGVGKVNTNKPYIGLSGIYDYKIFWEAMENGGEMAIQSGEAYGMRDLVESGINAYCFTWHDTGNLDDLVKTQQAYQEPDAPNILAKANEAIWFIDNQVIKFSDDKKFIANRVARVSELRDFVPAITGVRPHMYRYSKVEGKVLSEVATVPIFEQLLEYSKSFWQSRNLNVIEKQSFCAACMRFYQDKTKERINLFYQKFGHQDRAEQINGQSVPDMNTLLNAIDWQYITNGEPGRFHGDYHFENILYNSKTNSFTFLDWRQDFGGSLTIGDVYYDLAKLLHGLIICHELIVEDRYWVKWNDDTISFDFNRKQMLVECEQYYYKWLAENGYDKGKVRLLTALVYLNIAALHHYPYALLLFALGKQMLYQEVRGTNGVN